MKRRRAFLMIEVMFVLGVLGIFALVSTRLFYSSMGILHASGLAQRNSTRLTAGTGQLRMDLAAASAARVVSTTQLEISTGPAPVRWRIDGADIVRTAGQQERRWAIDEPMSFASQGRIILLCPGAGGKDQAMAIALALRQDILQGGSEQ